jgi:hypothetical protein
MPGARFLRQGRRRLPARSPFSGKPLEDLDWDLKNTRMLVDSIFRAADPMTVEQYLELNAERAEG